MNNKLKERIKLLPQVLQDYISEYNVEHRKQMKVVIEEFFSIIYPNCIFCNLDFEKNIFWSIDYFINLKYNLKYYWCNNHCFDNFKNDTIKNKCENINSKLENINKLKNSHKIMWYNKIRSLGSLNSDSLTTFEKLLYEKMIKEEQKKLEMVAA